MDKIKRFLNCDIPVNTCNLRCEYCFVTETKVFSEKLLSFPYDADFIAKAMSVKRLGGICLINLCGAGETLLPPEIIILIRRLLEDGHYVSVVTNGTLTKRIKEICEFPKELLERLFFKFSFHYKELVRLNLLDRYFENITIAKDAGASFTVEIVANDKAVEYIEDIKKICYEKLGTLCHVLESRINNSPDLKRLTNTDISEHQRTWSEFNSPLFEFQQKTWGIKRKEFCYAGELTLGVDIVSGNMYQCINGKLLQNLYENLEDPLHFCAIGENCNLPHCFISYVWLVLGGNIEEINTPTYESLRNRISNDGSQWLQPKMKEFFEGKASDIFLKYSEDKKIFINELMKYIFNENTEVLDLSLKPLLSEIIQKSFKEKGYKNIGIYGFGKIGKWLLEIIKNLDINIKYIVDKKYKIIESNIKCIAPEENLKDIDAIIITPFNEFEKIKKSLSHNSNISLVSIIDLIP